MILQFSSYPLYLLHLNWAKFKKPNKKYKEFRVNIYHKVSTYNERTKRIYNYYIHFPKTVSYTFVLFLLNLKG